MQEIETSGAMFNVGDITSEVKLPVGLCLLAYRGSIAQGGSGLTGTGLRRRLWSGLGSMPKMPVLTGTRGELVNRLGEASRRWLAERGL